ncbi:sulfotransferase family protein [Nocardioides sp. B-3]|uniref:sulfotransferase family protein n=1 Tax=Nocardioides sp. B-3 TaxID=2895565 RepID=UPI0021524964|nr:sulfotransferase [Nocardioides sp. B-3]UUZ61419.1 sulfotransferase [Nocardioides sp. B-3]
MRQRDDVGSLADITAAAMRTTGLTDLGDDTHEEGLQVLLKDYATVSGLTDVGNYRMRGMVKGLLVAKLMAQQGFSANPASKDVAIEKPVFIMGLPRSGTTLLQRLMTADPAHQGLEQWLADLPQPRPPRDTRESDPIFSAMQGGYAAFHEANPELAGLHYSDAASHEECWRLLQHAGRSVAFETRAFTPSYSAWLREQDWTPAYERHRDLLRLIGMHDADQRWILKNPSHLVALDAIRTVHPEAVIVVTHRDPVACTASMCSLAAASTRGTSDVFVGDTIGRTQLDLLVREQAALRASPHSGDVIDVAYGDLVADPLSTLRSVYAEAGLTRNDAVAAAASAELARSRSGVRAPKHAYDPADYGLTEAQVRDALEA